MISAAGEMRSFASEDRNGKLLFLPLIQNRELARNKSVYCEIPILYPFTDTVLFYILTRPSSSLSRIISRKFSKLVRPPWKVLTRSILRRSERRRYQPAKRLSWECWTTFCWQWAMYCSSSLPLLPNVKCSKRLLRFLELQYRAALCVVTRRAFHSRFSYNFNFPVFIIILS